MPALLRYFILCFSLSLFGLISAPQTWSQTPPPAEAFFANDRYDDAALSPDGRYIAVVENTLDNGSRVILYDRENDLQPSLIDFGDIKLSWVKFATNERLIASVIIKREIKLRAFQRVVDAEGNTSRTWDDARFARLMAIDLDGSDQAIMMINEKTLQEHNFNLSRLVTVLPHDPNHIIMIAQNRNNELYKVNVNTGHSETISKGSPRTFAWRVDKTGEPVVRYDWGSGGVHVKVRRGKNFGWKLLSKMTEKDFDNFANFYATRDPNVFYVSARPQDADKYGIYKYDLDSGEYLEKLSEHPDVDLYRPLRNSADEYIGVAYFDTNLEYDFIEDEFGKHHRGLQKFFGPSLNVSISETSKNGRVWLLRVFGPKNPRSYYIYDLDTASTEPLSTEGMNLSESMLGKGEAVIYKARDNLDIRAYITHPAGKTASAPAPLIVLPHGGPEARDFLEFDPMVQFLATRGYRVFQPQFRGSSGFGKAFTEAGYGKWGGAMQDDITDGVEYMIAQGLAEKGRICIMGSSYGGYAALYGAIKTPDLYKCAISINGVTELISQTEYDADKYFNNGDVREEIYKRIGHPKRDAERLTQTSPSSRASEINVPVLLIQGSEDNVVPVEQGRIMRDALQAAGKDHQYIELDTNHNLIDIGADRDTSRLYYKPYITTLKEAETFLAEHLE